MFRAVMRRRNVEAQLTILFADLRERCAARKAVLAADGLDPSTLNIGVGIHTGLAAFDATAISLTGWPRCHVQERAMARAGALTLARRAVIYRVPDRVVARKPEA